MGDYQSCPGRGSHGWGSMNNARAGARILLGFSGESQSSLSKSQLRCAICPCLLVLLHNGVAKQVRTLALSKDDGLYDLLIAKNVPL